MVTMSSHSTTVNVPNVTLTLDQLLAAIRQLDEPSRKEVARVLLATELDAKLAALLSRLAEGAPADDVSDNDINVEISTVRQSRRQSSHAEDRGRYSQPVEAGPTTGSVL